MKRQPGNFFKILKGKTTAPILHGMSQHFAHVNKPYSSATAAFILFYILLFVTLTQILPHFNRCYAIIYYDSVI